MLKNPQVSCVEKQTNKRDVITTKASRFFPGVTVSEETDDGGGMPSSAAGLLAPDADFDQPSADLIGGLFFHVSACDLCVFSHWTNRGRSCSRKWNAIAGQISPASVRVISVLDVRIARCSRRQQELRPIPV